MVSIAVETFGSWGPTGLKFIKEIGRKIREKTGNKKLKLGSVGGPVIQANGRLKFEDDFRKVCYNSLHSEPASLLSLPTVWGNPGMAKC